MKKILFVSFFLICSSFFSCQNSTKNYSVEFVDREAIFPIENQIRKANPLMLVVEISGNGKLSLNRIETGTIADTSLLSEKLRVIFDDREKSGVDEREVIIYPHGKINNADLEKLIESLADMKASPIWIIKTNL